MPGLAYEDFVSQKTKHSDDNYSFGIKTNRRRQQCGGYQREVELGE